MSRSPIRHDSNTWNHQPNRDMPIPLDHFRKERPIQYQMVGHVYNGHMPYTWNTLSIETGSLYLHIQDPKSILACVRWQQFEPVIINYSTKSEPCKLINNTWYDEHLWYWNNKQWYTPNDRAMLIYQFYALLVPIWFSQLIVRNVRNSIRAALLNMKVPGFQVRS